MPPPEIPSTVASGIRAGSPLPRVIGVGGLTASAVNTIVGSGIFGLPGLAAAMLGPAAVLAYVVCAVLIGLVGLCLAEVGSRVTEAGGLYAYATAAFGPVVGGMAGTLLWMANSVVAGAAVATLLVDTLALAAPTLAGGLPRAAVLFSVYAVFALVYIGGARAGARVSSGLVVIKLAPLLLLVAAGIPAIHTENLHWTTLPGPTATGQTAVLLFFAFMGVEGPLNASGEVAAPARTIPRAIFLALSLVAVLYVAVQLTAQGVLGGRLVNEATPLAATAAVVFGPWGARLLIAATALSAAGYLAADVLCSPRNMFAMAGRGQLPRMLARVNPRFDSPAIAISVYATLGAAVACTGTFRQLVIAATSGTLLLYLLCCVAVYPLRARGVATQGAPFVAPGGPFVPAAAAVIILWMLSTLAWIELAGAGAVVLVSGVIYAVHARAGSRPAPAFDLQA